MIVALTVLIAGLCLLLYLVFAYSFLVPAPRGLPILMYHKVSEDRADSLTVKGAMLERQFGYLVKKHYTTVSFATVLDSMRTVPALPPRPVIITFDDGYRDAYTIVFPLLKQYGLKATAFPVAGRIAQTNTWDATHEPLMDAREIREMADSGLVEFGLHSFDHADYQRMTPQQMGEDLARSSARWTNWGFRSHPYCPFPTAHFRAKPAPTRPCGKCWPTTASAWRCASADASTACRYATPMRSNGPASAAGTASLSFASS